MNLESDKRLNIQLRLDFSSAPTGEARQAFGKTSNRSRWCMNPNAQPTRVESFDRSALAFFSNRRIRTRTYGGVGGAEPRGSPLSRSLAPFGSGGPDVRCPQLREDRKRSSVGEPTGLTQLRHWPPV